VSLTIREYQERDRESCKELWRELTQRHRDIYSDLSIGGDDPGIYFEHYLKKTNLAGLWIAEDNSVVVGMAGLLIDEGEAEIEPVVVRSGFRSQGIGTQLIEKLKTEAKEREVRYLLIRPVARNVEAIACFYRAGFSLLGQIDMFINLDETTSQEWKDGITIHGQLFRY
jgi:GNAT superfamily N-acetyltransferase